jgi:hypothetical protein
MLKIISSLLFFLTIIFPVELACQTISGEVFEKEANQNRNPLPGVNVYWLGTTRGTVTDPDGKFSLSRNEQNSSKLVFSLLGYRKDTLDVARMKYVELAMVPGEQLLPEVEIKGRLDNTFTSKLNPVYTQVITTGELQRAACCNLAESFETNAAIDVTYSDAVTGARQIQMLGLSGIYSQIMTENIPMIRGLATAYGLNYIPGPWMESIQISKGASSVATGFESVTGQINVEYKKPAASEKLYLNAYMNSNLRMEANANGSVKFNDRLSAMLFAHASTFRNKFDRNDDGFMDIPLTTNVNLFNRWDYTNPGKFISRFGIKYLYEKRDGGQMDFDKDNFSFDTTGISDDSKRYGIGVKTNRIEAFWKNGIFIRSMENASVGIILYGLSHDQEAFYGINKYSGKERTLYASLLFNARLAGEEHKITAGFSYMLDDYRENYLQNILTYRYQQTGDTSYNGLFTLTGDSLVDLVMNRTESVPGAFLEYTYSIEDKFTLIAGGRMDYLNTWGMMYAPRIHVKININPTTILRGSAGAGYRISNVFAENNAVFVSQRKLVFTETLDPELAWNYGINFTKDFKLFHHKAEFSFDAYRTDFISQVIADMDTDPTSVYFSNLDGRSYANSIQSQLIFAPVHRLSVTLAFRYNDVKTTLGGELREKPMVSRYKGLLSVGYATKFEKWKFDLTLQVNGPQRLPDTDKMPPLLQRPAYSPAWVYMLGQITRKFKHFDVYLGGENLTNYRQNDPIVEYWKPYHTHFDASMVWGPVTGISVYAGVRYTLK